MTAETIKNYFKNMPELNIILVLAFFSLGIIITDHCPLMISFIVFFLAGLSAFLSKKTKIIIFALVLIFGGTDYFAYRLIPKNSVARLKTEKIEWAEGKIVSDIEKHSSAYIFYLKIHKAKYNSKIINCSGKIAVYLKCEKNIAPGDTVRLSSFFFSPKPQTNPLKFSYETYLNRKNIYVISSLKNPEDLTVISKAKHSPAISRIKHYTENTYKENLEPKTANLLMGMVLGNGNYLDDATYCNFINTSCLHLLAASGINCGILILIIHWLLCFMEFRKKNLIIIPVLWFYACLIGFPGSILRATVMCSLVLFGQTVKAYTNFRHILFLSAFIILIFSPNQIFDIGFQLSYLCLIGLLYLYPFINSVIYRKLFFKKQYTPLKKTFFSYIIVPISAFVSVSVLIFPISIYYFNYVSFVGLFANLAVGFLAGAVFVFAVLFLILCHIPFISDLFVIIINFMGKGILNTVNILGEWDLSTALIATPSVYAVILSYIIIFAGLLFADIQLKKQKKSQ